MSIGANFLVSEGTIDGSSTITFHIRFKKIIITNDSGSGDMTFRFHESETAATLKPTETVSMEIRSKVVILSGSNVNYRIWATT